MGHSGSVYESESEGEREGERSKGLKGVGIATDTTTKGILLASRRMILDAKRTRAARKSDGTRTDGTRRKVRLCHGTKPRMIIVAGITKVRRTKAIPNGNTATKAAFKLQKVCTMLWTNVHSSNSAASSTHQFLWIKLDRLIDGLCTCSCASKVCVFAFEALVISQLLHRISQQIVEILSFCLCHRGIEMHSHVFDTKQRLLLDLLSKLLDGIEQIRE